MHPCEDDIVCKCVTQENKVPYFNAPVYLENKEQIGKVDEIFGQLRDFVSLNCVHLYLMFSDDKLVFVFISYSCSKERPKWITEVKCN